MSATKQAKFKIVQPHRVVTVDADTVLQGRAPTDKRATVLHELVGEPSLFNDNPARIQSMPATATFVLRKGNGIIEFLVRDPSHREPVRVVHWSNVLPDVVIGSTYRIIGKANQKERNFMCFVIRQATSEDVEHSRKELSRRSEK